MTIEIKKNAVHLNSTNGFDYNQSIGSIDKSTISDINLIRMWYEQYLDLRFIHAFHSTDAQTHKISASLSYN